jgi:hypothetical protein
MSLTVSRPNVEIIQQRLELRVEPGKTILVEVIASS